MFHSNLPLGNKSPNHPDYSQLVVLPLVIAHTAPLVDGELRICGQRCNCNGMTCRKGSSPFRFGLLAQLAVISAAIESPL